MLDRLGPGGRGHDGLASRDEVLELPLHPAVVRVVVAQPVSDDGARAAAEGDVHQLRRHALEPRQQIGVEAELEHRLGFHLAGELGVVDLVAPGAEEARPLDPHEEIRATLPPAVEQRRLVDHEVAASHGRLGLGGRCGDRLAEVRRQVGHHESARAEV